LNFKLSEKAQLTKMTELTKVTQWPVNGADNEYLQIIVKMTPDHPLSYL